MKTALPALLFVALSSTVSAHTSAATPGVHVIEHMVVLCCLLVTAIVFAITTAKKRR